MAVLARKEGRGGLHYAWVVTMLTALVLLTSAGTRALAGLLLKPLEDDLGWSRPDISLAFAISIFWFGLGGPVAGTLIERFGPRRVMVISLATIAAGLGAMLTMSSLWQLHLFWGLIIGIGTGALANVLGATVAVRWFRIHRSVMVGVFGAAAAAGQLVFLPIMREFLSSGGWRNAVGVAALIVAALIIPVALFMRNRPEEKGVRALGDDGTETTKANAANDAKRTTMRDAMKTRDFWLLAGSFFICGWTTNGLIGTHLFTHAIEHGFSDTFTVWSLGVMGLMNIVGTLASGWLSDRYDNRMLLAAYYSLRALAIAQLPFVSDNNGLMFFAAFYGLDWISTVPPTINLVAQRFGRASVGSIYGWIFFVHMLGAGIAAYAGGLMRVWFGDYSLAFFAAAALGFLASAFSLGVRRVQQMQPATV
jgi:sugar phosphate permease